MKRWIHASTQAEVLRKIAKDIGPNAKYDKAKHCVDVFDDKGNIIEQHYAAENGTTTKQKFRYNYVGPGNGDYERIEYDSLVKEYTDVDHLIKYISHTNKDTSPR